MASNRGKRLTPLVAIAALIATVLPTAALADGEGHVVAWGATNSPSGQATVPAGLADVVAVAANTFASFAVHGDGTVTAWGYLDDLGGPLPPLRNVKDLVIAGDVAGAALHHDGSVTVFGNEDDVDMDRGQFDVPADLGKVAALAAGADHFVAARDDGTVVAWGGNFHGQTDVPAGLAHVVDVAAGLETSVALLADGTVVEWGGMLPYPDGPQPDPEHVGPPAGLRDVVAVDASGYLTVARRADGTLASWGASHLGAEMFPPAHLEDVTEVSLGGFGLALRRDGTVTAWGRRDGRQDQGQYDIPEGLGRVTAIAAGGVHALAVTSLSSATPTPGGTFSDVAGSTHRAGIDAVAEAGIAGGYADGTFRPDLPVTRGQMATFLTRALDLPAGASSFPDVAGSTHRAGIDAVAEAGIAGGYADGTFRPDLPVTRGQMATFLARALDL
jgi:hypothetical protein